MTSFLSWLTSPRLSSVRSKNGTEQQATATTSSEQSIQTPFRTYVCALCVLFYWECMQLFQEFSGYDIFPFLVDFSAPFFSDKQKWDRAAVHCNNIIRAVHSDVIQNVCLLKFKALQPLTLTTLGLISHVMVMPVCTVRMGQPCHRHATDTSAPYKPMWPTKTAENNRRPDTDWV